MRDHNPTRLKTSQSGRVTWAWYETVSQRQLDSGIQPRRWLIAHLHQAPKPHIHWKTRCKTSIMWAYTHGKIPGWACVTLIRTFRLKGY